MANETYNRFSADELRLLLSYLDVFDQEVFKITSELSENQHENKKINQADICWAQFYEEPFEVCFARPQ